MIFMTSVSHFMKLILDDWFRCFAPTVADVCRWVVKTLNPKPKGQHKPDLQSKRPNPQTQTLNPEPPNPKLQPLEP